MMVIMTNKATMYALIKQVKLDGSLKFSKWRDNNKPGPKPLLERDTINSLVNGYAKSTDGGCAKSRLNLEQNVNKSAKEESDIRSGSKRKFESLPISSMNRVVNRVMGLHKFNIMNKVSNKTQSHSAAEFSVHSTIAYLLVVLSSHFINAPPSTFHYKQSEIIKLPVYKLIAKLNKEVLGGSLVEKDIVALTCILPNFITSTDECTLFVSSQQILNKTSWYFCICPSSGHTIGNDSNRRDCYTTDLTGDAHLRGIIISLNNTVTAGGRCAPIFACVTGLKPQEMPHDEIVVCEVKGLVAASTMTGSTENGYIIFVRGQFKTVGEDATGESSSPLQTSSPEYVVDIDDGHAVDINPTSQTSTSQSNDDTLFLSKESRVAKLYRELVYYPFIKKIRTEEYDMPNDLQEIPSNLTAVSWMDGCHGQLKLTTMEDVLKVKDKLKIVTCKHGAARTAMEQACDVGPMFKTMKGAVKKMPSAQYENTAIYHRLTKSMNQLESDTDPNSKRVVKLPAHKKNAIIVGLSKLPIAMSTSFTSPVIQSAFVDNGQLDATNSAIPNIEALLGTY